MVAQANVVFSTRPAVREKMARMIWTIAMAYSRAVDLRGSMLREATGRQASPRLMLGRSVTLDPGSRPAWLPPAGRLPFSGPRSDARADPTAGDVRAGP